MKFTIYSIWLDYKFYIYLLISIISFITFIYSIKKLLISDNESENQSDEFSEIMIDKENTSKTTNSDKENIKQILMPEKQPELFTENTKPQSDNLSPAEEFIKNLYAAISNIDERIKNIEKNILSSKNKNVNNEFVLKFLEDIINDYDSLDKEKIKARIQFLISDLKKQ